MHELAISCEIQKYARAPKIDRVGDSIAISILGISLENLSFWDKTWHYVLSLARDEYIITTIMTQVNTLCLQLHILHCFYCF